MEINNLAANVLINNNPLIDIALYINGEHLDPDLITEILQIKPSSSKKRGVFWTSTSGRQYTPKIGCWVLTIESSLKLINNHIKELLEKLNYKQSILLIDNVEACYLDILIIFNQANNDVNCNFYIDIIQIEKLRMLGVSIQVTMSSVIE